MKATITPLTIAAIVGYCIHEDAVLTIGVLIVLAVGFVGLMCFLNTDCRE